MGCWFRGRVSRVAHTGYTPETWDQRKERICRRGGNVLANYREIRRRQSVDIDTCLYAHTLYTLAGERIPEDDAPILPVLAASVQQYWVNALAVQGYILGPETDELNRRLPTLLAYTDLSAKEQEGALLATRVLLHFAAEGF